MKFTSFEKRVAKANEIFANTSAQLKTAEEKVQAAETAMQAAAENDDRKAYEAAVIERDFYRARIEVLKDAAPISVAEYEQFASDLEAEVKTYAKGECAKALKHLLAAMEIMESLTEVKDEAIAVSNRMNHYKPAECTAMSALTFTECVPTGARKILLQLKEKFERFISR